MPISATLLLISRRRHELNLVRRSLLRIAQRKLPAAQTGADEALHDIGVLGQIAFGGDDAIGVELQVHDRQADRCAVPRSSPWQPRLSPGSPSQKIRSLAPAPTTARWRALAAQRCRFSGCRDRALFCFIKPPNDFRREAPGAAAECEAGELLWLRYIRARIETEYGIRRLLVIDGDHLQLWRRWLGQARGSEHR